MNRVGVWATGGSQDHGHTLQERQASPTSALKETNAERGAEESFLPDEQ